MSASRICKFPFSLQLMHCVPENKLRLVCLAILVSEALPLNTRL